MTATTNGRASAPPARIAPPAERLAARVAALQAAATFCGHYATMHEEVKSTDVLRIAELFERWLLRETDG